MSSGELSPGRKGLAEGQTSVGSRVDVRHLAASPNGSAIKASAELVTVNGKSLTFRLEVQDIYGVVAEGTVERFVIDRAKFIERASQPRS